MYARNVAAFLLHLTKDQKIEINTDDEITRETLVTQGGEVVNARVREFFSLPAKIAARRHAENLCSRFCHSSLRSE